MPKLRHATLALKPGLIYRRNVEKKINSAYENYNQYNTMVN